MVEAQRLAIWRGLDAWRVEAASIELTADGLSATGTQIGSNPVAYRVDYRLEASVGFLTRSLVVAARGWGWQRHLDLRHDGEGSWTLQARAEGAVGLAAPGGEERGLDGALDSDLGYSPLTNLMPVRRSALHRREGAEDFLMAWVSVPGLQVVSSAQRYEHVQLLPRGSLVRYVDRGLFPGFTAELELDQDGVVVRYPGLAELVGDEPSQPEGHSGGAGPPPR